MLTAELCHHTALLDPVRRTVLANSRPPKNRAAYNLALLGNEEHLCSINVSRIRSQEIRILRRREHRRRMRVGIKQPAIVCEAHVEIAIADQRIG